jgi:hypothetical protein
MALGKCSNSRNFRYIKCKNNIYLRGPSSQVSTQTQVPGGGLRAEGHRPVPVGLETGEHTATSKHQPRTPWGPRKKNPRGPRAQEHSRTGSGRCQQPVPAQEAGGQGQCQCRGQGSRDRNPQCLSELAIRRSSVTLAGLSGQWEGRGGCGGQKG